jgi:hypothetical protein
MNPMPPRLPLARQQLVTPELIDHHRRVAHGLHSAEIRRVFGQSVHILALPLHALSKFRKRKKEKRPCVSTI